MLGYRSERLLLRRFALLLTCFAITTSHACADIIKTGTTTWKNTSTDTATDFQILTSGPVSITIRLPPVPPNKEGQVIADAEIKASGATRLDLGLTSNVAPGGKATVTLSGKGAATGLYTKNAGVVISTESLSMAPTLDSLGGNKYQLVFVNNNGAAVDLTSLAVSYNNTGDPTSPDFTPNGTPLVFTPPSNPILPGETFTSPIFQANLSLPVFGSDTVALDSAPTDLFPENWSFTSVPEPSTLVLAAIGMAGMIAGHARHMSVRNREKST